MPLERLSLNPIICTVPNCGRETVARGYCGKCYKRLTDQGILTKRPKRKRGAGKSERMISQILAAQSNNNCWVWPFYVDHNGYANATFRNDTPLSKYKTRSVCRIILLEKTGAEEEAIRPLDAAHRCGNGHLGCVNPAHLYWATRLQNIEDAKMHGTHQKGCEKRKVLSDDNVRHIRYLGDNKLFSCVEMGKMYGVSSSLISGILRRERRTLVPETPTLPKNTIAS